jgi:uncharacterized protein (TIRG00374 family)
LAALRLTFSSLRAGCNRPEARRALVLTGYLFSAACLLWVFHGIDYNSLVRQYQRLQPADLLIGIAFSMAVYFVNSLRLVLLLRPIAKVSFWRTLQAIYIALFTNEVLPLRPGELIRCYLLSRWSKLPLANLFASAAVERILDGLCMMAGFFAVAFAIHLPRSLLTGATILGVALVVLALAWVVHAARKPSPATAAPKSARKAIGNFLDALASMGSARVALQALAVSCLALACFILAMWFLTKGGGIGLTLAQAAAVFLIIRVGTVIPNAPGNIGSYQFFCVLAMGLFGIGKSAAAAFSVLIYSAFTVPLLLGGAIAVLASGLNLKTLLAAAES